MKKKLYLVNGYLKHVATTLLTLKDIAISYDHTKPTNHKGKSYRGTAHEFQDYAYRLASDLRDLENLQIYMRLAKNVPRYLLETSYQYVADSNVENKGRLFLWKLKQLKQKVEQELNMKNYDYSYVIKQMAKLRNTLSDTILKKEHRHKDLKLSQFITSEIVVQQNKRRKQKILFVGATNFDLMSLFLSLNWNVFTLDISKEITKSCKRMFNDKKGIHSVSKDFLKHSYKSAQFDMIVVDKQWQMVPLDIEEEWLTNLASLLNSGGSLFLGASLVEQEIQQWDSVVLQGVEHYYFKKLNDKFNLRKKVSRFLPHLKQTYTSEEQTFLQIKA